MEGEKGTEVLVGLDGSMVEHTIKNVTDIQYVKSRTATYVEIMEGDRVAAVFRNPLYVIVKEQPCPLVIAFGLGVLAGMIGLAAGLLYDERSEARRFAKGK